MAAEPQGTVIRVEGAHTLHEEPILGRAGQVWPEKHSSIPLGIFIPKGTCNTYRSLSHTVERSLPDADNPAAGV
jgi:hypothetical protein